MTPHLEQRLEEIAARECYEPASEYVHAMRLGVAAALEWLPIDESTPTDEMHIRGLQVFGPGKHGTHAPLYFAIHIGYIDDDGCFVDYDGSEYGWRPEHYTHWMPLPPSPKEHPNDRD